MEVVAVGRGSVRGEAVIEEKEGRAEYKVVSSPDVDLLLLVKDE